MKRNRFSMGLTYALVSAFLISVDVGAAESAAEILKKMDAAGFAKSTRMKVSQQVITPSGDTRTFRILSYTMDGNEKALTHYVEPEQVRGMKILSLRDGNDIWTYFPKTNRTRKIASSARNRKVQGSDFTYDDMAQGKMVKQWQGGVVGEENMEGTVCYKLALTPTSEGPKSYKKIIAWIDKAAYTPRRIEYYDLEEYLLKRLDIADYKKVSGVLVPFSYTMTNVTDGGKTLMKVAAAEVNVSLDPVMFTEAGLCR